MASNFTDTPDNVVLEDYHYIPTEWICILMVTMFGLSTIAHVVQAVTFRFWWIFPTAVLAGILEIVGWSARLWSSQNTALDTPFTIQIALTIIAPTPLLASNFIILGQIIGRLGPQYSRLKPKFYTILFLSSDIIALIVQSVGGSIAATTAEGGDTTVGANITLGGIVFQLFIIVVYMVLGVEFLFRYQKALPVRYSDDVLQAPRRRATFRIKLQLFGLVLMGTALFIRSVYRTAELSDGWNGRIISTQVYFDVLDGGMIILTTYTLNILHPGFLLRPSDESEETLSIQNPWPKTTA